MREVQSVAEPSTLAFGFSDQRLTQEGWTPLSSKATACWVSTTGGHRPGTDVSQPNPCEASANLPTLCRWDLERMQSKHSYEYQLEGNRPGYRYHSVHIPVGARPKRVNHPLQRMIVQQPVVVDVLVQASEEGHSSLVIRSVTCRVL